MILIHVKKTGIGLNHEVVNIVFEENADHLGPVLHLWYYVDGS